MCPHDIAATLQQLGMIDRQDGRSVFPEAAVPFNLCRRFCMLSDLSRPWGIFNSISINAAEY